MQEQENSDFKELSELNMFEELYRFFRESTGLAIATAYLALILSSMAYLYVLFNAFDISIVKYVTFEDILATPIKNPAIVLAFIVVFLFLYAADLGNRYRARQQIKYANITKPASFKIIQIIFWAPKKRKTNIKTTALIVTMCFTVFIFSFATDEADNIKEGVGSHIEISLADDDKAIQSILLGTTINYVFTYNPETNDSIVFSVEAIKSLKKISKPESSIHLGDPESKVEQSVKDSEESPPVKG